MLLYLDNCCFNRPYDDQSQVRIHLETEAKLVVQERLREGQLNFVWSYILDIENGDNPFEERRERIWTWRGLAAKHIVETEDVLVRAESFLLRGLKAKDALHLSCAIEAEAEIFLTTDRGILRKSALFNELAILNPVDYDFS